MPVALIVEPQFIDAAALSTRFGEGWMLIPADTPAKAITMAHALVFDMIVVPITRVAHLTHAPLFSAIRLIAPTSHVVRMPDLSGTPGQ